METEGHETRIDEVSCLAIASNEPIYCTVDLCISMVNASISVAFILPCHGELMLFGVCVVSGWGE